MKVGFCERDITPVLGMERPGGYSKVYIKKIHDPLKVRACVIDDNKTSVALVGVDTLTIPAQAVADIRDKVEKTCVIKGNNIMFSASHDHSAGPLFGSLPERFKNAPQLVKDLALNHSIVIDPFYYKLVVNQTISAICEAEQNKKEALLSVGSGYEDRACYNRRFKMKNGRVYTHPGKGNPDIIGPAGPIDPEVGVIAAWQDNGNLLGCVVNYACHGTTSPFDGVSSDWIYFLERTIQGVYGKETNVVFLNGACGDVTQVNNLSLEGPDYGERVSRIVGQRVGAEALKVLATAFPGELTPVDASNKVLHIKRRKPGEEHIKKSLKILDEFPENSTEWTFAKEVIVLDYLIKDEPELDVEIQAIQVGPAIFLSNPSEYFCEFGLEIKKKSPFPFTYVVELANGCVGYVPTKEAFEPTGGGYETVLTSYSNLEISAGEKIAKASIELANKFKPGKIPEGQKVEPFSNPWSYGVLGPDLE